MANMMVYDASLIIDEYTPGEYCMFLRRPSEIVSHDIPDEIAKKSKDFKRDFSAYRKDKLNYRHYVSKKIDKDNYVVTGMVLLKTMASWLDDKEEKKYLDYLKEKYDGKLLFLQEYLENTIKEENEKEENKKEEKELKAGYSFKDAFMEYTVLEVKNDRLSKVKIFINPVKAEEKDEEEKAKTSKGKENVKEEEAKIEEISNEEAAKIEFRGPVFSYEAGLILGINKDDNKIYVQFEDTQKDKCQIFVTGIALDPINDAIFKMVQNYGEHVQ